MRLSHSLSFVSFRLLPLSPSLYFNTFTWVKFEFSIAYRFNSMRFCTKSFILFRFYTFIFFEFLLHFILPYKFQWKSYSTTLCYSNNLYSNCCCFLSLLSNMEWRIWKKSVNKKNENTQHIIIIIIIAI